jgi:hypothetical protein
MRPKATHPKISENSFLCGVPSLEMKTNYSAN